MNHGNTIYLKDIKKQIDDLRSNVGKEGVSMTLFGETLTRETAIKLLDDFQKIMQKPLKAGFEEFGIHFEKIKYMSKTPNMQEEKELSALLIVPMYHDKKDIPLICYQHGSTLKRENAPSQYSPWLPKSWDVLQVIWAELESISKPVAWLMPDYQGMGEDKDTSYAQPLLAADPLAYAVADAIDSVYKLDYLYKDEQVKWNKELYLMGYSQGGFVTMTATRLLRSGYKGLLTTNSPKINLIKCAPMGGPYALSEEMVKIFTSTEPYPEPTVIPQAIRGFYERYKDVDEPSANIFWKNNSINEEPADLIKVWDMILGLKETEEEVEHFLKKSPINGIPYKILHPKILDMLKKADPLLIDTLKKNEPFTKWDETIDKSIDKKLPIKLFHATNDKHVNIENAEKANKSLNVQAPKAMLEINDVKKVPGTHIEGWDNCWQAAMKWFSFR